MHRFIIQSILFFVVTISLQAKELVFTDIPSIGSLRTSTVHTFHKDSSQILWIGTDKEVIAFDGNNGTHIAIIDENGIPSTTYEFAETPHSDIIAATNSGIYLIDFTDPDKKPVRLFPQKINAANCLAVTSSDSIVVGTNNGFFILSPNLKFCSEPYLSPLKIRAITPDGPRIFIATDQGVYSIDLATKLPTLIYGPFNASSLLRESNKLYAASSNNGLVAIDLSTGQATPIDVGQAVINALDNDSNGNVYIATDGDGILVLEPNSTSAKQLAHSHIKSNQEHNNQIYTLMVDRFDRMHVGYYLMGAEHSLLSTNTFSILPLPGIDSEQSIRAVYSDGDKLMVGTRNGAVYIDNATGKSTLLSKEMLKSGLVLTIEKLKDKYIIGTYGSGLSIFDPASGKVCTPPQLGPLGSVFSLTKDKDGNLWIGASSGVYKSDGANILQHIVCTEANDSMTNIYTVFFDSSGRGWAASAKGTYNIDQEKGVLVPNDKVADKDVRQIYETRNHDLWMVTNAGKVTVYKSDLQKSDINSLVSTITDARGMVEDDKGRVWITSTNGLYKCTPFDGALSSYGFIDGIPSPMFNSGAPKISEDNILYLCHTGGLLRTDLKSISYGILSNRKARPSFITDAGGMRMLSPEISAKDNHAIKLLSPQKSINLSITDAAFAGNEMERYEFSLDNGNTWRHVSTDMNIPLTTADRHEIGLKVRQIGNPLTETDFTIVNPKSMAGIIWISFSVVMIILITAGWLYTIYAYKKKHASSAASTATAQEAVVPTADTPADDQQPTESDKKYATNYLTDKECAKIAKQMKAMLTDTKLYTDPDLKIATVAEKIGISSHKLSYFFSQYLHTSYYDYIYEYRVQEFKRLAKADKKQAYTLVALSEKAGFNSRATFFRAFKKIEGVTPGEYMRLLHPKN